MFDNALLARFSDIVYLPVRGVVHTHTNNYIALSYTDFHIVVNLYELFIFAEHKGVCLSVCLSVCL